MVSSTTTTLLFESGIMKISDYDPIHNCYLTRTLQLPTFPLFNNLDIPFFEPTPKLQTPGENTSLSTPTKRTMSRFIEHFELADAKITSSPVSNYYTSSTIRSSRSTSLKKTKNSIYSTKSPRRCYSNPNLSKKIDTMIAVEPLDPTLLSVFSSTSKKAPKRSLSNAFHVLSGLLPTKSKRRLNNKHDESKGDDHFSRISTSSSSSTIRMAWQGTTWLDEMKTSSDFGSRQRLASIDQSQPWWTATAPLSNGNVSVNA